MPKRKNNGAGVIPDLKPLGEPVEQKYNKAKIFLDFLLLVLSFVIAYFIKRRHLNIEENFIKFLPLYFCCWVLSSILTKKLKNIEEEKGYMKRLEPFFASALFFTGLLSLLIYGLNLYELSRFIVFGSCGIFLLLEILFLSGNYLPLFSAGEEIRARWKFSIAFFFLEFLLITTSFLVVHFFKIGTVKLLENYEEILLLIYFLWIFTGLLIHRFRIPKEKNFFKMVYPFVKSNFIVLSIASLVVFGFRTGFSRLLVFGSLAGYALIEILIIALYYVRNLREKIDVPEINFFEVPVVAVSGERIVKKVVEKGQDEIKKISVSRKKFSSSLIRNKLKKIYLKGIPGIFNFIDRVVDLDTVDILKAEVIDTGNPYNVEVLPDNSLDFFMNLHTINDYRRVNKYLIEVNRKIKKGGVFIGKFEPCEKRRIYFLKNYPHLLANILYFFDFTYRRVFPKFPLLKRVYFAVTKGRNRLFSMAEAMGRLYFCGFEILSLKSVDHFIYFVVRKIKKPHDDPNPSYGLLFKQKRIGFRGEPVYIYKLRTMHPYSEYIHQYVFDKFKLDKKGKIKGDFRVTSWGRFFRKFWIDEIPMWINWLKGDIKLVGVRPLSETFFNTYPEDLQKQRTRCKPGLVPPYYADMPQSMEEVWASERNYLDKCETYRLRTDFKYFFKAVKNILFHKAKSA